MWSLTTSKICVRSQSFQFFITIFGGWLLLQPNITTSLNALFSRKIIEFQGYLHEKKTCSDYWTTPDCFNFSKHFQTSVKSCLSVFRWLHSASLFVFLSANINDKQSWFCFEVLSSICKECCSQCSHGELLLRLENSSFKYFTFRR